MERKPQLSKEGRRTRIPGLVAGLLLLGGVAQAAPLERLAITAATWRPERAELKVEGISRHVDAVVLVRDADTRKLLGSAAVRRDGKWMLKVRDPAVVPSRMRAELNNLCTECTLQAWADSVSAVSVQAATPSP